MTDESQAVSQCIHRFCTGCESWRLSFILLSHAQKNLVADHAFEILKETREAYVRLLELGPAPVIIKESEPVAENKIARLKSALESSTRIMRQHCASDDEIAQIQTNEELLK